MTLIKAVSAALAIVIKAAAAGLAILWRAAWYLPAWLAGAAWFALRHGWADGNGTNTPEE